ncbi:MAG TPA: hypothetical protein VHH55_04595 [Gaiellaceae bacterium]|nr:hypothetical protein [Gaiellaceae bacterium]
METLVRIGFRSCYLLTLASGTAAAHLAALFRALGEAGARIGPLAVVIQLPVVLGWLVVRPISLAAFAGCTAFAARIPPR